MSRVMGDRARRRVPTALWPAAGVLLLLSVAATATIGPADLSVGEVVDVAAARLLGRGLAPADVLRGVIVWDVRLPRGVLALCCGAGLGICGTVLQSLLRNPLGDPYILGISSGASAGAVIVSVLGVGAVLGLSGGAFVGCLVAIAAVLALTRIAGAGPDRLVLAGVAVTPLLSALTSFLVVTSADPEQTRGVLFWLLGSVAGARWSDVAVVSVVVVLGGAVCLSQARALDAFAFGEDAAAALGIHVARARAVLLIATAGTTAVIVSAVGAIGFVGLVLPHAARALVGSAHRLLLPTTALLGAIYLTWVDAVARVIIAPQEMPVGVVTALLGVPVFALILGRRGRRS